MNAHPPQTSMATVPFLSAIVFPRQAGITILEILISLSLGLLLVIGIGTIFVGSNQTYRVQEDSARMQETGRFAIETIGRALRQAGYADIPVNPVSRKFAFAGTTIHGINTSCPAASPSTDVITIQYDGMAGEQDCQANNVTAGQVVQQTFFLGNGGLRCNAVLANAPPTPPTACPADNSGDELVRNIEDLQVLYGIDTNNNQSVDQYTATPGNWGQVVSAKVCVLVRSENTGTASTAQRYLNCQGALGVVTGPAAMTSATDTRLRRAFVATFNLRNRVTSLP